MPQRRTNKRVHADTASSSPIYPPFSAGDSVEEDLEARCKRIKHEDLDLINFQEDIQDKRIKRVKDGMDLLDRLNPTWMKSDTRFRMHVEDIIKNIILSMAP